MHRLYSNECCHHRSNKAPFSRGQRDPSEKKKAPRGWPACLKRSPLKAVFQNNNIYAVHASEDKHHYEELKEKELQEEGNQGRKI